VSSQRYRDVDGHEVVVLHRLTPLTILKEDPMYHRGLRLAALLFAALLLGGLLPTVAANAQTAQRCFPETGFCIEGRLREFWEQNGALPVFGFPTGPQQQELIEGQPFQVQWFERNRLEMHPENARPYDVLLGRLGADRLAQQGRDPFTFPKSDAQNGCRFFPETGHNVCGDILKAWRASGLEFDGKGGKSEAENLALFGLPLSDPMTETLNDSKQYTVQWFERGRFELHSENAPPYNILLGLLGNEVHQAQATPSYEGAWMGTTSLGKPFSFVVANNAIKSVAVEYDIEGRDCEVNTKITGEFTSPPPITGSTFTWITNATGISQTVTGTFNSATDASGIISANIEESDCAGAIVTTWAATKQP
jgi:hypothetical protein